MQIIIVSLLYCLYRRINGPAIIVARVNLLRRLYTCCTLLLRAKNPRIMPDRVYETHGDTRDSVFRRAVRGVSASERPAAICGFGRYIDD